jgi:hypothetical protein
LLNILAWGIIWQNRRIISGSVDTEIREVLLVRQFVIENARERERLRTLVTGMTDEELSLPLGEGWTIAAAFAHLAFWDQRALVLLRKCKKSGVALSPMDTDTTNDALLVLCLALSPGVAANLAVSSAEAIDRELEESSPELIVEIEGLGEDWRLYRSQHRKLHLDEIESFLQTRHGTTIS